MNNLKQALEQMTPADPDPRDQFFRHLQPENTGSAIKEETDMNKVNDNPNNAEEQEKLRKTRALSPKGL